MSLSQSINKAVTKTTFQIVFNLFFLVFCRRVKCLIDFQKELNVANWSGGEKGRISHPVPAQHALKLCQGLSSSPRFDRAVGTSAAGFIVVLFPGHCRRRRQSEDSHGRSSQEQGHRPHVTIVGVAADHGEAENTFLESQDSAPTKGRFTRRGHKGNFLSHPTPACFDGLASASPGS